MSQLFGQRENEQHDEAEDGVVPAWTKVAIDAWMTVRYRRSPGVPSGEPRDSVQGAKLSEKVVWQTLRSYAAAVGLPGIAPHDLRRTCAKLWRAAGGELEQISNAARASVGPDD